MPPAPERRELMRAIARALSNDISASTTDIAAAAGIGRTTLHRTFGTRADLMRETAAFVIDAANRVAELIGFDDAPPRDVLGALAEEHAEWALTCGLLWYGKALTSEVDVAGASERLDARVDAFVVRAQAEGVLRADRPPRWITYSLGSQALAAYHAVQDGFVAERTAGELFLSSIVEGFAPPA